MNQTVASELNRVLNSKTFENSKRLSELLEHIIQSYLDGKSDDLTGITIAQDLFKKGADFDPSKDPVVRVNIARLRKMLSAYYKAEGASNPLRISIPKGGYKPKITEQSSPERPRLAAALRLNYILGAALAVLGLFFTLSYLQGADAISDSQKSVELPLIEEIERYPTVAVLPFQNQTLNPQYDSLKYGFQRQIVSDLYPFRVIRVIKLDEDLDSLYAEGSNQVDYAIKGSINALDETISLTLRLIDVKTRNIILTEIINREAKDSNYYRALSEISAELSNNFGGPEGAIVKRKANDIKHRLQHTSHMIQDLSAFECFSRFSEYREFKTFPKLQRTYTCLEEELHHNPDDSTIAASLATLYYEIGFINNNPELIKNSERLKGAKFDPSITLDKARKLALHAVSIDPRNDIALGYLADMQMADGDITDAYITLQQAMAANRGNPNHISNKALVLSYLGQWDEALALAREAIARNPNPEGYYYMPQFYHAILIEDGEAAKANLPLLLPGIGEYMTIMFTFLTASLTGDKDMIEAHRDAVQKRLDGNKKDPFYVIRFSGGSDEIFAAMRREFKKSGIIFNDEGDIIEGRVD